MTGNAAMKNRRVLLVEHNRITPGGLIEQWVAGQGATYAYLRIDMENSRIPDPNEYDLVVSLGSQAAAYDDAVPFVSREIDLMESALRSKVPILGVCFGGQLLARVLGGQVYKSTQAEIGWFPVKSYVPQMVSAGPWFQWHFDTFRLPREAQLLGESDIGPQAFRVPGAIGLQFHPEVTPTIIKDWIDIHSGELQAEGIDGDALLAETQQQHETNKTNAEALLKECVSMLLADVD